MELREGLPAEQQLEILVRNAAIVTSEAELREKLTLSVSEKKPLKVKLGLDPSAPDIHLGHTVVLRKLREFQDLGHEVICLIGDFTGRVGDPSGAESTRRQLSQAEVEANARTYQEQIFKVLDPDKTTMDFNSRWLAPMSFAEVVELAAKVTVARMLERNDFSERLAEDRAIYVHEFFYPLMQGYDSVALKADVELGGTDQTFNLMMARQIQRAYKMPPEVAITMPVIEGTDGVRKMSKSFHNYIGVMEAPDEMLGKLMSIPDELILRYFQLLTSIDPDDLRQMETQMKTGELNPKDAKLELARQIVSTYHSNREATEAIGQFQQVFSRRELPDEMPTLDVTDDLTANGTIGLVALVVKAGFAKSNSEARRLIEQGAVSLEGEKIKDPHAEVPVEPGTILRVGKRRFARLHTNGENDDGGTRA